MADINRAHAGVERARGARIPEWAYRDVLYMLISYSIQAFEALERPLTEAEKAEVFDVFGRVGQRMGINDLPTTFLEWELARRQNLAENLAYSAFTSDLYQQYRRHLGPVRYQLLLEAQRLVAPPQVRELLQLGRGSWLRPIVPVYRRVQHLALSRWLRASLLPTAYKEQILALEGDPTLRQVA
jgi:hypothetical protein